MRLEKSLFPAKLEALVNPAQEKPDAPAKPEKPERSDAVQEELAEWEVGRRGGANPVNSRPHGRPGGAG